MAQFLSPEWFAQMQAAASHYSSAELATDALSLREIVTDSPFGDITYVLTVGEGKAEVLIDETTDADVTFTQDYETAAALHRGELTTRDAFFGGRVRVRGRLINELLRKSDVLESLVPAFADVRASTTY